jgi:hypothetical protein
VLVESPNKISRPSVSKKKKKSLSKKRKTDSESADHSDDDVLVNWIKTFQSESALDSKEDEWVKWNLHKFNNCTQINLLFDVKGASLQILQTVQLPLVPRLFMGFEEMLQL